MADPIYPDSGAPAPQPRPKSEPVRIYASDDARSALPPTPEGYPDPAPADLSVGPELNVVHPDWMDDGQFDQYLSHVSKTNPKFTKLNVVRKKAASSVADDDEDDTMPSRDRTAPPRAHPKPKRATARGKKRK